MSNSPMLPLFAPDGTLGYVPYEHVGDAIAAGGKVARKIQAPNGDVGYVPAERAGDAIKAGGKPLPIDTEDADGGKKGFWSGAADAASRLLPDTSSPGTFLKSELGAAKQFIPALAPQAASEAAQEGVRRATRPMSPDKGLGYRAANALSPLVPTLNPESMEAKAEKGDTSGILGEAAVPGVAAASSLVVPKALQAAGKATAPMRAALADKMVSPLVYENVGESGADVRSGITPEKGITQEGLVGTREGLLEQSKARVAELKSSADNILQNHTNSNRIIDAEPIIDGAIDDAIAQTQKVAGSTERLEALRDALKTKYGKLQGTPYEINNLKTDIQKAGNQLGAYRNTQPIEGTLADAMKDVATRIRGAVNDVVPEAADLNNRMANSIDAQSGLQKGINAEKGKSVFGGFHEGTLSKVLNRTAGSAPVRTGIARLLNAGNTLDVPGPMAMSPFVPRGLFDNPTSAVPAGWEPDASGPVRGGRWTTPAALLSDQAPIEAEFIPRRVSPTVPFRAGIDRMLPSGELPATNIPPALDPQYSVEDLRTPDSSRVGPPGREATRTESGEIQTPQRPKKPTKGLLPWNSRRGAAYVEGP